MTWRDSAACTDTALDWMAPTPTREHSDVCGACPVKTDCLTAALTLPPGEALGIWGGVGEAARRRLRKATA